MIKKLSIIGLLILFFCIQISADELNDEEIFNRFISHIKKVYMTKAMPALKNLDYQYPFNETNISVRLLGYSLGNLILHAPRGTENYEFLLMLEKKTKDMIISKIKSEGLARGWTIALIENRKQEVLEDFMRAQQGWADTDMARLTNVRGRDAPNFFDTLVATPPDPPTPPTPPTPPAPSIWDAVEGTYTVIGQSWENDPDCGGSVILKGSMARVETVFKLWDRTGETWNYQGNVQFVGKKHGSREYKLSGITNDMIIPNRRFGSAVSIKLGDDNHWRATSIDIGGNTFNLQQKQSTGRKKAVKILTIKNSTDIEISVFLKGVAGRPDKRFGSIDANSEKSFTGIPERGRWYFSVNQTTQSYINPHNFTLYVKEDQFVYFHEVKPEHFR